MSTFFHGGENWINEATVQLLLSCSFYVYHSSTHLNNNLLNLRSSQKSRLDLLGMRPHGVVVFLHGYCIVVWSPFTTPTSKQTRHISLSCIPVITAISSLNNYHIVYPLCLFLWSWSPRG